MITPPPPSVVPLTITFIADPEDALTARTLGWGSGIPGLTVTVAPADSSSAPRAFTTGADGTLAVSDLPAGRYVIDATRVLTDAQRGTLTGGDDAVGFATRAPFQPSGHGGTAVLTVPAIRRRSLVIGEWALNPISVTGLGAYFFGGFLELYNNADTTVYLDGVVLMEGFPLANDYPNGPCALYRPYTDDPLGVWGRYLEKFPGSGRDYPVAPGRTIVIATDAIDHRPLFPGAIDLRSADFESTGPADVDNPAVPNMVDVGLSSHSEETQRATAAPTAGRRNG